MISEREAVKNNEARKISFRIETSIKARNINFTTHTNLAAPDNE